MNNTLSLFTQLNHVKFRFVTYNLLKLIIQISYFNYKLIFHLNVNVIKKIKGFIFKIKIKYRPTNTYNSCLIIYIFQISFSFF